MHHEAVAKRETGIKQFCEILKEDARLCSLNTGIAVINVHKNVEFPAMCSPQVPNGPLDRKKTKTSLFFPWVICYLSCAFIVMDIRVLYFHQCATARRCLTWHWKV